MARARKITRSAAAVDISGNTDNDSNSVMSISSASEDESAPPVAHHKKKKRKIKKNKKHGINNTKQQYTRPNGTVVIPTKTNIDDDNREDRKKEGDLRAYFTRPPGRPKNKKSKKSSNDAPTNNNTSNEPSVSTTTVPIATKSTSNKRGIYNKQPKGSELELAYELGIQTLLETSDIDTAKTAIEAKYPGLCWGTLKRGTLYSRWKKIVKQSEKDEDGEEEVDDLTNFDRSSDTQSSAGLTTEKDITLLQNIAQARDNCNRGMPRKEMISLLADMKGVDYKTAENHYDYLVRKKVLKQLKGGGRVVSSQATTTNRTAITTAKLLRTHQTYSEALERQKILNGWQNLNSEEYKKVADFFTVNLDESCMMASDGTVKVIGNANKRKQEKNSDDCRDSITVVRTGSAAGIGGPRLYLAKGKTLDSPTLSDMPKNHNAPAGSCVVMTPNAYMTTEAWQKGCPILCKGIRQMEGIRGHDDKWVIFSLDGFGSHLDPESLQVFNEYKILVIKEEGDTSQVSQAYDQIVAKQDKRWVRQFLDAVKLVRRDVISQWTLIAIVNAGINEVEKDNDAWRKSFIRVNMCPSKRVPFEEWVKKHELIVKAADRFFKERGGLFDAMPACWQHMSEEQRRGVCAVFDLCNDIWTKENVVKIMQLGYVHFDDIPKLRGCYLTSKEDPSVFLDPPSEEEGTTTSRQLLLDTDYHAFSFAPKQQLDEYTADKAAHTIGDDYVFVEIINEKPVQSSWTEGRSREVASNLFCSMTNFVAANHGWKSEGALVPSAHLDVDISADQQRMLNPTLRDVQVGAVIDQCAGDKAKKRIAKRRVDFVTGNVNSYARLLNGPEQLSKITTYNQLAASMAEIQKEKMDKKAASSAEKKKAEEEKAAKKLEEERKEKEERERLLPICSAYVAKGMDHVLSLNMDRKKEILKHIFNQKVPSSIRKPAVDDLIKSKMAEDVPPLEANEPASNLTLASSDQVVLATNEVVVAEAVVQAANAVSTSPIINNNATWLLKRCSELRTEIGIEMSGVDLAIIAIRELDKIKLQQNNSYLYDDKTYSGKFKAAFRGRYIGDSSKQVSDDFIKDLVEKCTELMDDETLNEENIRETVTVYSEPSVAAV